ncbi:NIPSNAP family protein [Celeribacter sp.]|uniref:NIPSNAP family protein n=1 Tax=Celeribacter sp. TaxID=1890673 RepID=UPI003A8F1F14
MLYDHRTYTCRPGTIRKHLALYGEHGYDIQRRHLGNPVVYGAVETGDVNSSVHIWCYADAADRATKRAALAADPEWQAYLAKSAEAAYLVSQVNQLMSPAPFFTPPQL